MWGISWAVSVRQKCSPLNRSGQQWRRKNGISHLSLRTVMGGFQGNKESCRGRLKRIKPKFFQTERRMRKIARGETEGVSGKSQFDRQELHKDMTHKECGSVFCRGSNRETLLVLPPTSGAILGGQVLGPGLHLPRGRRGSCCPVPQAYFSLLWKTRFPS